MTTINTGEHVHAFSPWQARAAGNGGLGPCTLAVVAEPIREDPDGGLMPAALLVNGQRNAGVPHDRVQAAATPTNLDASGRAFRPSWHEVDRCKWSLVDDGARWVRYAPAHPLDEGEQIIGEAVREGRRIAVTSAGRKVALDAEGLVIDRLSGPEYAAEAVA